MGRRKPTEEQKAAAAARRAKMREYMAAVQQLTDDQRTQLAEQAPAVTVEGHVLSIRNQCLIALQQPDATLVGGFRQWRNEGRHVRKDEHGLMIWFPSSKKTEAEGDEEDAEEVVFRMGTVFDVQQTQEHERAADPLAVQSG